MLLHEHTSVIPPFRPWQQIAAFEAVAHKYNLDRTLARR
jgi:hypothetical protein